MINDIFRDLYNFELKRKDGITSRLPFCLTLLTVLGSILAYIGKQFPVVPTPLLCLVLAPYIAAIIFWVSASLYIYKCIICRPYSNAFSLLELAKWNKEVNAHFENDGDGADKYMLDNVFEKMAEATAKNSKINEMRSKFLNRIYFFLGVSATLIFLCAIVAIAYITIK